MKVLSLIKKMISIETTKKKAGIISICILILALIFIASPAKSADYYVAQYAAGSGNGDSCTNATAISYYTGSWSGKVSAGDTVHLCGTLTSQLAIGGSGTSGNPITVKFENGAKFSAPYWSTDGAISCSSKNYITIDGGTNGIIENTDNGTGKTYVAATTGINTSLCNNLEIKNLTIQNMLLHYWADTTGTGDAQSTGIGVDRGSNIKIHNNTINYTRNGISYANNTGSVTYSSIEINNNIISRSSWGMNITVSGTSSTIVSGVLIHDNDFTIGTNYSSDGYYHVNGIFIFGGSASEAASVNNLSVYNNYFHDEIGGPSWSMSGYIHWSQVNGTGLKIFNNVFTSTTGGTNNGYIYLGYAATDSAQPIAPLIVNNTFVSYSGNSANIFINQNNGTAIFKNNIVLNFDYGFNTDNTGYVPLFDYNAYYSNTRVAVYNGVWNTTLPDFQTTLGGCPGTGHECHGIATNPNLNSDYTPKSNSPTVGTGVNLTSLGITALNRDKRGVARPSSGTWSIGAYEYPSPSVSLTVSVSPAGTGTVTSSDGLINCGSTCSVNYASGTSVTLTASPNSGYTFTGWSGGGCSGTGTCTVTITAATSVTATFTSTSAPVTASGGGGGGCFIATAAYGSYLDPHVYILKNFRDHYLLTNYFGKKFVEFYYKNSPPVAKFIAKNDILKTATRWVLTPVVYSVEYPNVTLTVILGFMFLALI